MTSDTTAHVRSVARLLIAVTALGAAPRASMASAPVGVGGEAPPPSMKISQPDLAVIWNDPGFQKSFIGGYGVSADIEPRIAQDDMALLELVRQLMAEELPAAETLLKESVRPEVSASSRSAAPPAGRRPPGYRRARARAGRFRPGRVAVPPDWGRNGVSPDPGARFREGEWPLRRSGSARRDRR